MSIPLNILFVAIPEDEVAKIQALLQADGYSPRAQRAEDIPQFEQALPHHPDVLICGLSTQFSVAHLVAMLQERSLDIPLIVFSSDTSGESLLGAMRSGARDYVFAEHPERLLLAIQRELAAAAQRANQRELVVSDFLLQEIDHFILQGNDLDALTARICRRIVELFDFKLVWIGLKRSDGLVERQAAAGELGYLDGEVERWDDTPEGNGAAGQAIRTGQPVVLPPDSPDFEPWRERAERFGIKGILALPLLAQGRPFGALMLYCARAEMLHDAAVQRLTSFASRITVAMLVAQEQQELRLLRAAMSNASNAMFITDLDGSIEWMNDALLQYSHYTVDELLGQNPRIFGSGEHDEAFWRDMWQAIKAGNSWRGDVVNSDKSGKLYIVSQNVSPLFNSSGELTHFLAIQQDISDKKRLEEEVRFLAYHDSLTGLPNRMLFEDRVQQAVVRAERYGQKMAVMFIDLDGFKQVNDTYGHARGDELLIQVAERMKNVVRSADTVARLAGDEFTVLLQDVPGREGVHEVARKLLNAVAEPYDLGLDHSVSVTVSIGVSTYPMNGEDFDALLSHSDQAMYTAKSGGKNRIVFFGD
jgi:diguanylate cyclase (GGDEF)-like protein/PAS domain S-box-containing protein